MKIIGSYDVQPIIGLIGTKRIVAPPIPDWLEVISIVFGSSSLTYVYSGNIQIYSSVLRDEEAETRYANRK